MGGWLVTGRVGVGLVVFFLWGLFVKFGNPCGGGAGRARGLPIGGRPP